MKITVITPSFNQGRYLEETIRSVLSQQYEQLEYIIIDGGSSDDSAAIIRKYASKLHYWISEPDRGQTHAINKGLQQAGGDVIHWVNSDDLMAEGSLQAIADAFADPSVMAFCGRSYIFGGQHEQFSSSPRGSLPYMFSKAQVDQPSTVFRREVYQHIPLDESLHYAMDLDLWFAFLCRYGNTHIAYSDSLLLKFREHESSKTISRQDEMLAERILLAEKWKQKILHKELPAPDPSVESQKKEICAGLSDFQAYQLLHSPYLSAEQRKNLLAAISTRHLAWRTRLELLKLRLSL